MEALSDDDDEDDVNNDRAAAAEFDDVVDEAVAAMQSAGNEDDVEAVSSVRIIHAAAYFHFDLIMLSALLMKQSPVSHRPAVDDNDESAVYL